MALQHFGRGLRLVERRVVQRRLAIEIPCADIRLFIDDTVKPDRSRELGWQYDRESAAMAGGAREVDGAAVDFDDPLGD